MPPTVASNETREQATIRWLTRILAALVRQSSTESLTIKRNSLNADPDGLDLLETRDKNGNVLLRFESTKHMAIYPLSGGPKWEDQKSPGPEVNGAQTRTSPPLPQQQELFSEIPPPAVTSPKTQTRIKEMEELLKRHQFLNKVALGRLQKEKTKRQSLEGLLENADLFSGR